MARLVARAITDEHSMDTQDLTDTDPEIAAISVVFNVLKSLDAGAQARVIGYVSGKLGLPGAVPILISRERDDRQSVEEFVPPDARGELPDDSVEDGSDSISPVAQKWIRRNGLTIAQLSRIFSIGGDEIDLIADSVPGANKKARMRSVILLKGIAAYLASGAARVSHQEIKETCLHYDAFDSANFATYLKDFSAEVSGSKESGFTLTPRGLAAGTELIKTTTREQGDT